jgi:membrane protease YdiL (CAAX protease family)
MSNSLRLFAKVFLIFLVLITVFLYFFAIFMGPALFYFTPEGLNASTVNLSALKLWVLNIPVYVPVGVDLGLIFFAIWSIFISSFIAAWKFRESFYQTVKKSVVQPTKKLFSNCLFAMPILNSMTLIAIIAINSFQEAGGIPTGMPPLQGESFLDFFDLSYSVVAEEVGFRLIPIGAFLLLYLLKTNKKVATFSLSQKIKFFFTAILFPDNAKRMVGTKTVNEYGVRDGISLGEWGMVIFSSIIFGFAHFDPGISWEIGKVSSAAVAGLVLGLSYLLYGIQASIIMHWFFNVYSDTFFLLSEINPAVASFANWTVVFSVILGILGWSAAAIIGFHKLVRGTEKRDKND